MDRDRTQAYSSLTKESLQPLNAIVFIGSKIAFSKPHLVQVISSMSEEKKAENPLHRVL